MRNFFTEIENNKSKTILIVFGFFAFMILVSYIISLYLGRGSFVGILGMALIFSGVFFFY